MNDKQIISTLIDYINQIEFPGDYDCNQPVFHAAIYDNKIEIVKLFVQAKDSIYRINMKDREDRNALSIAIDCKNLPIIELLLNYGATIKSDDIVKVRKWAIEAKNSKLLKQLEIAKIEPKEKF